MYCFEFLALIDDFHKFPHEKYSGAKQQHYLNHRFVGQQSCYIPTKHLFNFFLVSFLLTKNTAPKVLELKACNLFDTYIF